MKKYLIKIITLIIAFIIIFGTHYSCLAKKTDKKTDEKKKETQIKTEETKELEEMQTGITSNGFVDKFNPEKELSTEANGIATPLNNTIKGIVKNIVSIIQLIGGILTVVSVTMFGFNMILTTNIPLANSLGFGKKSPQEMQALLDFGKNMIIGAILLFSSATFVKLMLNIFLS